jgi:hypothetical protein
VATRAQIVRYMLLPWHVRLEIAKKVGIFRDGDEKMSNFAFDMFLFERLKSATDLLPMFWQEVEACHAG